MTSKSEIEETLLSGYAARVRGDIVGTMDAFSNDVVFEFNGKGTGLPGTASEVRGKAALQSFIQQLIDNFRFSDWRVISLLIDGQRAMLHWRATITATQNGRAEVFDVFDFVTFRDGKIAAMHQSTDTAMIVKLSSA